MSSKFYTKRISSLSPNHPPQNPGGLDNITWSWFKKWNIHNTIYNFLYGNISTNKHIKYIHKMNGVSGILGFRGNYTFVFKI